MFSSTDINRKRRKLVNARAANFIHCEDALCPAYPRHIVNSIPMQPQTMTLLERNKSRRVGSTNTWATVLDWLIRDGELAQVVTDHFRLDFDLVEFLRTKSALCCHVHVPCELTFPEYTATTLPIISGTTIISRKCVRTASGFSFGLASCLAFRSFLIKPMGLRLRPRLNRRRAREWTTSRSCSEERSRSLSEGGE